MGRARVSKLFPVAVSISMAAELTKLPVRLVREAIYKTGELEARIVGNRVRIPVESIVAWLRTFPRATLHRLKGSRK
jgi:hypothetical protein